MEGRRRLGHARGELGNKRGASVPEMDLSNSEAKTEVTKAGSSFPSGSDQACRQRRPRGQQTRHVVCAGVRGAARCDAGRAVRKGVERQLGGGGRVMEERLLNETPTRQSEAAAGRQLSAWQFVGGGSRVATAGLKADARPWTRAPTVSQGSEAGSLRRLRPTGEGRLEAADPA